jgi:hypothetical protein
MTAFDRSLLAQESTGQRECTEAKIRRLRLMLSRRFCFLNLRLGHFCDGTVQWWLSVQRSLSGETASRPIHECDGLVTVELPAWFAWIGARLDTAQNLHAMLET